MKLLDLQTGKYLELGNFYYGGNMIMLRYYEEADLGLHKIVHTNLHQMAHTNPIINQVAEKVGAVIYGGRYVLTFGKVGNIVEKYRFYVTGHRNLKEYCLLYLKDTMMYTTPESDCWKDIFISTETLKKYELDRGYNCENEDKDSNDKRWYNYCGERSIDDLDANDEEKEVVISNIFEEFAKKEQGLENKFDELYKSIYETK